MQGQPRRHTKARLAANTKCVQAGYETRDIQTDEHATTGSGHITELAATEVTTQAVTQSSDIAAEKKESLRAQK